MGNEDENADGPEDPRQRNESSGPQSKGKFGAGLSLKLRSAFHRARGIPIELDLGGYRRDVERIHAFRKDRGLERKSDEELRPAALELAQRLKSGFPPEEAAVEAFALADAAARRTLGLIPHDVQLIAGLAMCGRKIAELPTGEGKTMAAVFPASLLAMTGRGAHVLTFNDYLARRDAAWMGPVYRLLGLTVGFVQEGMAKAEKRRAYACDVTYATAREAGFDFLRDGLAYERADLVHRPFHAALVDEADSILIDEARIPLVIAGLAGGSDQDAGRLASLVRGLVAGRDYETDDEKRNVNLTDAGLEKAERLLGRGNLYTPENESLLAAVHCALHAEALLRRDVDYIVREGRIDIVDEFTGRVMDKRHWPDGLQAAVEAKENVSRKSEGRVLGSITLQYFFRLYPKLCGMTATAGPSAAELHEFYGLRVTVIPPHRPCLRADDPDLVFTHREAKLTALVREIAAAHAASRPILVGTLSVKESEELAAALAQTGVPCRVLNAKNDEVEAGVIARAGRPGAVTISTNMAGRGTDIKLGGEREEERERVVALGGLYVIGTNRHESLRIDRQLRGRAGRQGDPGSSRFFISLEDDLFERYGLRAKFIKGHRLERQAGGIDSPSVRRDVIHAQRVIEGQNFDIRKTLEKYSSVVETQRQAVGRFREAVLTPGNWPGQIESRDPDLRARGVARFGPEDFDRLERRATLFHTDRLWADHLAGLQDLRESIHLVSIGGREPVFEFGKAAAEAFAGLEERIAGAVAGTMGSLVGREGPVDLDAEGLRGPSSTWTYLVSDEQFGWGIGLLKGSQIGFTAVSAGVYGPLFVLALVVNRLFGKRARKEKAPSPASESQAKTSPPKE
jgi:preprotein translocase subunit SecA